MIRRTWKKAIASGFAGAAMASMLVAGPAAAADKAQDQKAAQEKAAAVAAGNSAIAGQVQGLSGTTLTLIPYGQQQQTNITVPQNVPVFQGKGKITTKALMKGVDARVHYNNPVPGQAPQAVAIEVLSPQEASAAKGQPQPTLAQNAPAPAPAAPAPAAPAPVTPTPAPAPVPAQTTPPPVATAPAAPAAPAAPQPTQQMSPQQQQQMQKTVAQASGSQPGKIISVTGDQLKLDPYQKAAGNATLRLSGNVPVYQGNGMVSAQSLQPGTDVRVYYKNEAGQRPSVVAVQVLNPQEAKTLERSERSIPRGK